jgi:hypothetical protein
MISKNRIRKMLRRRKRMTSAKNILMKSKRLGMIMIRKKRLIRSRMRLMIVLKKWLNWRPKRKPLKSSMIRRRKNTKISMTSNKR